MRILITNDDGILSEGIVLLARWAKTLGEVTVCAPKTQQSGKSHAINIHVPFEVTEANFPVCGVKAYCVDSTPVDCVRFATLGLNQTFDLVLSGVNKGLNLGEDILYSGTVGVVFEAALRGIPAVAFSTEYDTFAYAEQQLPEVWQFVTQNNLFDACNYFNVNIPKNSRGMRITRQGGPYFTDRFEWTEQSKILQSGYCVHQNNHDWQIDTDATIDGFVTITPLSTLRYDVAAWDKLKKLNEQQ